MDGTILGQGSFVASSTNLSNPNSGNASIGQSNPVVIQIPSGADWVKVRNFTQFGTVGAAGGAYFNGTANANVGVEFYWQRGMANGSGIVSYKASASAVLSGDTLVSGGFTLYDPSGQDASAQAVLGNPVATTASTNATRPVVSTASTAGVQVGSIVRLSNTAQNDINGIDFVVGAVTVNTSFTLLAASNALATAPGAIGGAGFYRLVNYEPLFYPRRRYITKITQAANAQVSTSVPHNYAVGQSVRFNIPAVSGMVQLNPSVANSFLVGNVVSVVDAYNFTVDINSSAFTAFTWPTIAQQPSSFPEVTPVGEDSALSLSSSSAQVPLDQWGSAVNNANNGLLSDAAVNTGYLGMLLGAGGNGLELTTPILGPSGSIAWSAGNAATGDVLYWLAGKSTYGGL